MEGKGGLGGRREGGEVRMDPSSSASTARRIPVPRNSRLIDIHEYHESASPPYRFSPFSFITEPHISALYVAAQTTFPEAEKTFTTVHSHCLEVGTEQRKGKEGNQSMIDGDKS